MDPRIAPTSSLGTAILAALQSSPGEPQVQALLALVGQNLDLLLLEAGDGRATLRMPAGQVFQAEGELDFPPGTRITVQVQPPAAEAAGPRLKLVEALPPPPASILAPLVQGEGTQLLARLLAQDPPTELLPLARMLADLSPAKAQPATQAPPAPPPPIHSNPGSAPASSAPAEAAPIPSIPVATVAPPTARIQEWLQSLPPSQLRELQRLLLPKAAGRATLPELAEAVAARLPVRSSPDPGPTVPPAPRSQPAPAAALTTATAPPSGKIAPPPPTSSLPVPAKETLQVQVSPESTFLEVAGPPTAESPPRAMAVGGNTAAGIHPPALLPGIPMPAAPSLPFPASADPLLQPLEELLRLLLTTSTEFQDPAQPQPAPASRPAPPSADPALRKTVAVPFPELPSPGRIAAPAPHPKSTPSRTDEGARPPMTTRLSTPGPALDPAPRPTSRETAAIPPDPRPASAETWATWLSEGTKILSDPLASPREAPFHLAQAKEGTAFFELPLPWAPPGKVLQMWVEADGGREPGQRGERAVRVLVGLQFSALGETRVGLVRSGGRIQVRIWAEHPERLKAREAQLRMDLADLGPDLDLQVLALGSPGEPVPSLRALAAGAGFQALG